MAEVSGNTDGDVALTLLNKIINNGDDVFIMFRGSDELVIDGWICLDREEELLIRKMRKREDTDG